MGDGRQRVTWVALAAACGAAVIGLLVWVVLALLTTPPAPVATLVVGGLVGYVIGWQVPSGGLVAAVIAATITTMALAIGFYYADRLAFIAAEQANQRRVSLPLRPPWNWFWHVVRAGFDRWILQYPYAVAGVVVAAWSAATGQGARVAEHYRQRDRS